jgi:hypothetical protein
MRHDRESEISKIEHQLKQTNEIVSKFMDHYHHQYNQVRDVILPFKGHTRMDWPRLNSHEAALITSALHTFQSIPPIVIKEIADQDTGRGYELALICQLIGVGAFYTDDIDAAIRYLDQAKRLFSVGDPPKEYLYSQAFCSHFLGLIDKNWRDLKQQPGENLAAAKGHLEDASHYLAQKDGEFLTPLTLAEILSYSEHTREDARGALDELLERMQQIKVRKGLLDKNQSELLGRALLIRGNVEYTASNVELAQGFYEDSFRHTNSAFAKLSLGQTLRPGTPQRLASFKDGLDLLENPSGPLTKREASGRLTAVAWAAIAAREVGDNQKQGRYERELEAAHTYVRIIAGREPLFFCPIEKVCLNLKDLVANALKPPDTQGLVH